MKTKLDLEVDMPRCWRRVVGKYLENNEMGECMSWILIDMYLVVQVRPLFGKRKFGITINAQRIDRRHLSCTLC
jgi:hypothetical protein